MTEDASPKNLRKFLESDDPALVQMGLSMAKGSGVPEDLLEEILWMYMMHDDKTIRAAAKSTFMKMAPKKLKDIIKNNWKTSYRTLRRPGERFTQVIRPLVQSISQDELDKILSRLIKPVIKEVHAGIKNILYFYRDVKEEMRELYAYTLNKKAKRINNAVKALGDFGIIAVKPLIVILEYKKIHQLYHPGVWKVKETHWRRGGYTVNIAHRAPNTIAAEALQKLGHEVE